MSNMVVRTNVMSLNSHRNLGMTGTQQARAAQRLSSGFRINSAADDAAGLGISEKMRAQIRGLDQASRNGQDGISLIQTAEGAMSTINEMVVRIRELVIQAANDTNAQDNTTAGTAFQGDRARIQDEINQLLDEIDATVQRTEFNTRTLLDGSLSGVAVPAMADDVRALVDGFLGANPAEVTQLGIAKNNIGIAAERMEMATAYRDRLNEVRASIEAATSSAAMLSVFTGITNDWIDGVTKGTITDTSDSAQAAFINAALADHFDITMPGSVAGVIDDAAVGGAGGIALGNEQDLADLVTSAVITDIRNSLTTAALTGDGLAGNGEAIAWPTLPSFETTDPATTWGTVTAPGAITDFAGLATAVSAANTALGVMAGDQGLANLNMANKYSALNDLLAADADLGKMFGSFSEMMEAYEAEPVGGGSLWFQIGANPNQGVRLSIESVDVAALDARAAEAGGVTNNRNVGDLRNIGSVGGKGVMLEKGEDIQEFVTALDAALAHVSAQRSNLGAMQNRLEFTIQNLDISSENLQAAESRIRDADMAREMMRFTQSNVLQQAAISMLAQANMAPQNILQLLG